MVCHTYVIADYCEIICLVFNPITNTMPKAPPTTPPPPWSAAKTKTPPNILDRNTGLMKKRPIIRPAMTVETNEIVTKLT